MTTDPILLIGIVITAIASIGIPLYLRRQVSKQAAIDRLTAAAAAAAAGEELSWEAINRAIVLERNDLRIMIKEQDLAHEGRIRELQARFDEETQRLKIRSDYEQDRARAQIQELRVEIDTLYRRLSSGNGKDAIEGESP